MLEVQNLSKKFGNFQAVKNVSFDIEPGMIMGFIGPNGSGKTTVFRMILDFLNPEPGGKITWNQQPVNKQLYNIVGYLPEERGLYEKMTIEDQIIYFASLRGMKHQDIITQIDEWMEKFAVKGKRKDKINTLSKGNQQKIQLIATLIHRPKLVILDEPFSGLDPVNADLLKQGILELKAGGSSIIFSSHNMENVSQICDKLAMILNGEQVLYGTINEVREQFGRVRIYIESNKWNQESLSEIEGVESVIRTSPDHYTLNLSDESYGPSIFQKITQGQYISMFSQQPPTLEEIFKLKVGDRIHE
ncbi:ABC transporter ATP-binding protein [Facklamia miroungae]|uniref:ABC-2 type transport system ATP-binding protein n=1 Tax=Facklamia miroungae TaxID=120956 RepID=A0A1G7QX93_9LACT|nr:ABC transporter ATP-binding protein [Facklamia miroungae]NKZ29099.1 ABC transporter ATP-binding protein [Facklamia miroungae]SDG03146.1 ABC-2 type transport system ATP-binding protein [Facklamia miroungae]